MSDFKLKPDTRAELLRKIQTNFLKQTICRLDYGKIFDLHLSSSKIQSEFNDEFKIAFTQEEHDFNLQFSDNTPEVSKVNTIDTYNLATLSGDRKIKFSDIFLSVEHLSYFGFPKLNDDFAKLTTSLFKTHQYAYNPARLGLRKINVFIMPGNSLNEFEGFVNPHLFSKDGLRAFSDTPNQMQYIITFDLGDDLSCNLTLYSEKGEDNGASARRFILDVDVYTTKVKPTLDAIKDTMNSCNNHLFDIFWYCIGDKIKDQMQSVKNYGIK